MVLCKYMQSKSRVMRPLRNKMARKTKGHLGSRDDAILKILQHTVSTENQKCKHEMT